jgi:hypothetical protein
MTRNEIIDKTLKDLGFPQNLEHDGRFDDDPDEEELIVAELQRVLPEGDLKTCADFKKLSVECCENCHRFYPHYDMILIETTDGHAWVCCAVAEAVRRAAALAPDSTTAQQ